MEIRRGTLKREISEEALSAYPVMTKRGARWQIWGATFESWLQKEERLAEAMLKRRA